MATVTLNATNSGAVTITLTSVTNTSYAVSSAIDNSTAKYLSALVKVQIKTGASGTSATGVVNVYVVRSTDGGSAYEDNAGTLIGSIAATANATTYTRVFAAEPLGTHWKISVQNLSGATLDASVGGAQYTGVKYDVA